ncbi:MAG: cation diffusion facilitator family transporter [Treponema sp.]|nr:cation diffusion facilitator family transporter [Treponema sp.]
MLTLLIHIFIKNKDDYKNPKVRQQYGELCGFFGIFLNFLLFLSKFIFGTIAASVSMIADAFNNLSDAASSCVQIIGFSLSSKKPDSEHPFGHGRIEYISGLIVSFLILLMGVNLVKTSVLSLFHPKEVTADIFSITVLVISILIKMYMYFYNHKIGKKIGAVSMEAVAKDSLSDMISTVVVLISVISTKFTTFPVDGIGGIIVGCFILKNGIDSIKETTEPLLGAAPSKEFIKEIEEELLKHKPIQGMHDLVVHDYGPGRKMISLHAEVPGDQDIFVIHEVIDEAEVAISKRFNCNVVIHMDPIDVNNHRLEGLKVILKIELAKIHEELKFHDVRMVPGIKCSKLIFDVVKPFSCTLTDDELVKEIQKLLLEKLPDMECVITVDSPYT